MKISTKDNENLELNSDSVYAKGVGNYNGTNPANAKTLQQVIDEGLPKMTEITWSELKTLRDNSQLTPGMQYRITDYITTTVQENTQSAGHQFDIIVVADSVNKLNENARACLHEGDTYFANSKLEAWELKYRLDNDTKFIWADTVNGKGVIYWMKDAQNNICPYDFKNILFKRYKITATSNSKLSSLVDNYLAISTAMTDFTVDSNYFVYRYTFCNANSDSTDNYDASLNKYSNVYNNNISTPYYKQDANYNYRFYLNNNVFCRSNIFLYRNNFNGLCANNTFASCYDNIFGSNCTDNIVVNTLYGNIINNLFYANISNKTSYYVINNNIIGNVFNQNVLYNSIEDNIIGNECSGNTLNGIVGYVIGNYCYNNDFGYSYCKIGDNCFNNTIIGSNNIIENNCYNNVIGIDGYASNGNHLSNFCNKINIQGNCNYNYFGSECNNIKLLKRYSCYNIIEMGNKYIEIDTPHTTSSSNLLKNITVAQGVNNSTTVKTISVSPINNAYKTIYQNSNSKTINV